MSLDIWMLTGAESKIAPYRGVVLRCVEDQSRSALANFADSAEEERRIEEILEATKPPFHLETPNGLDKLLSTPFRYPPLTHGSRFGTIREPSLFYAALEEKTTLCEVAFYQMEFLRASEAPLIPFLRRFVVFKVEVKLDRCTDLNQPCFEPHLEAITSVKSYEATRLLSKNMKGTSVQGFLFPSARNPGGKCFAAFSPKVFPKKQIPQSAKTEWSASVSRERVLFLKNGEAGYTFEAERFFEKGEWPGVPI